MKAKYRNKTTEVSEKLVDVAMGRAKADLVIKNGRLVNVHTAEIVPGTDIAVAEGRIALIGDASGLIGPETVVIDADGKYLAPGFLDGHIHVESSMVTVTGFAQAVLPHGTTAIFMDPHEIANVLGLEGVRLMHQEGRDLPLRVFTTIPSCVPAAPQFEDAGAVIGPAEIREGLTWEGVAGLGEMMNFPGVLANDTQTRAILAEALASGKTITGHYAMPAAGPGLQAYMATGITSCHESVRAEDALAKIRLGMYTMLREGSAWHDVKETIRAVTENRVDSTYCILVSDDTHPHTLLETGHLNHVIRRAIEEGLNPVRAIQMATINTSRYFRVDNELGSLSPGKYADIVIMSDLSRVKVDQVLVAGTPVAREGKMLINLAPPRYPDHIYQSVQLGKLLTEKDFALRAPGNPVTVRVISVEEASVITRQVHVEMTPDEEGFLRADTQRDLAKLAVFERHGKGKGYAVGFVTGFGFTHGAVAQTVAHDSHNLLVMGTNDTDMALAANILAEHGGGMVAVSDGEVLALVELPVAGILSDKPVAEVAAAVARLEEAWRRLGCKLVSPFMTTALLSLPVIPELRLTNRGLIDVNTFQQVGLFVEER